MKEKKTESMGKLWATRIRVLLVSGILASIANMIYDWRTGAAHIHLPWEVFPALLYMFVIIVVSCLVHDLLAKVLPFQVPVPDKPGQGDLLRLGSGLVVGLFSLPVPFGEFPGQNHVA